MHRKSVIKKNQIYYSIFSPFGCYCDGKTGVWNNGKMNKKNEMKKKQFVEMNWKKYT